MAGIFSIKRLVKGGRQREENWKKEGEEIYPNPFL